MSSADTWMPLYVGDYLADTGHLTTCEHGALLLLLMHYWRNGPLPDNDKQLAAIARLDRKTWVSDIGPTIREFFEARDGKLYQKRADLERAKADDISSKRRAAAVSRHHGNGAKPPPPPHANAPANAPANAGPSAPVLQPVCTTQSQSQKDTDLDSKEEKERNLKNPDSGASHRAREAETPPNPPDRSDFDRDLDRLRDAQPPPTAAQIAAKNLVGKVTRALGSTATHAVGKRPKLTAIEQQDAVLRGPVEAFEDGEILPPIRRGPVDPVRSVAEQLAALGFPNGVPPPAERYARS